MEELIPQKRYGKSTATRNISLNDLTGQQSPFLLPYGHRRAASLCLTAQSQAHDCPLILRL
jgi:hypothetical protein